MSWRTRSVKTLIEAWPLNGHVEGVIRATDMTWFGTEGYADTPWGRSAADFGGSADYLRRVVADWQPDAQGTITAWIKRDGGGVDQEIFCSADEGDTARYFRFEIDSTNVIAVTQRDGGAVSATLGSTTVPFSGWAHVAAVSNGSSYDFYVNGEPETISGTDDGAWLGDTTLRDSITIGALRTSSVSKYFNGQIGEVHYYPVALTRDEVMADMRAHG